MSRLVKLSIFISSSRIKIIDKENEADTCKNLSRRDVVREQVF